jgi:UDP-galactopyranose mutase
VESCGGLVTKALVIGGGFGGCTAAHQLELLGGWDVTLIEAAPFLGAGNKTQWWGGHPYTFGPRHFLTQRQEVFDYLNNLIPLRRCPEHEFLTYVERDNQFYNYPIHRDDVIRMPDREKIEKELEVVKGSVQAKNLEEYWIAAVGPTLYDKMVNTYTKKMWMIDDNTTLDTYDWSPKGVALKEGPRACWDTAISAYPYAANGYDDYFPLSTAKAKVLLSTVIEKYEIQNKKVFFQGEWHQFDLIINTIAPDILFDKVYGELPFRGRDLHLLVFP